MGRRRDGFNAGAKVQINNGDLEPSLVGYEGTLVDGKTFTAPHGDGPKGTTEVVTKVNISGAGFSDPINVAADALTLVNS